jgi:hypothetical protein
MKNEFVFFVFRRYESYFGTSTTWPYQRRGVLAPWDLFKMATVQEKGKYVWWLAEVNCVPLLL